MTNAEKQRRFRKNNPQACAEIKRRFRKRNAKKIADYDAAYYQNNKEKLNAKRRVRYLSKKPKPQKPNRKAINLYRKKRRASDPVFRIQHNVGIHMRAAIRGRKSQGWQNLVGYSASDLVAHLEAQFEPWMRWENYGTDWHIDHRRPISSFSLPEQVAECWSLSNLRPLSVFDNLSKKSQIILDVIPTHLHP